ncbi:phosphonate metabolism protein/1,5-bisphosphokinase (PRPP-forming) PhnN [Palleronia sp. KMU-117]|uniref:phosphonate metabolism protein/1,5-bisphosphokinase (PRPP-forming) PhnN n=1 Tax=Palleronia sp. KMU-117 TaxID=3434108 RepID=UPI003D75E9CB
MTAGRLVAVVGPSGVGKDTVIAGLCAARPDLFRVRRAITREAAAVGEDFEALSRAEFAAAEAAGAYALSWRAHGLAYGIPAGVHGVLGAGQDAVANLSRGVLDRARSVFPGMAVLALTAGPAVLAARLAARGRESAGDVAGRLARAGAYEVAGDDVIRVSNDGPVEATVARVLAALYPDSAWRLSS